MLIVEQGLSRERMVLVSTEWFAPYRPRVAALGFAASQIVERPLEEALAARDGSGFYARAGHPSAPAIPTVFIHYALGDAVVSSGPAAR